MSWPKGRWRPIVPGRAHLVTMTSKSKIRLLTHGQFVDDLTDLLAEFKSGGGDRAFLFCAFGISLALGRMDKAGSEFDEYRRALRKTSAIDKVPGVLAREQAAELAYLREDGGSDPGRPRASSPLERGKRETAFVIAVQKKLLAAKQRIGPRPQSARHFLTAALITHLEYRGKANDELRWELVERWRSFADIIQKHLKNSSDLVRFIGEVAPKGRKLDQARLMAYFEKLLPPDVQVAEPAQTSKCWYQTRALTTKNKFSRDALKSGRDLAMSWDGLPIPSTFPAPR